jgi:hypothetical protein
LIITSMKESRRDSDVASIGQCLTHTLDMAS